MNLGSIVSYQQQLQSQNKDTITINAGDICEGTYLSEINPLCNLILDEVYKINFDINLLGNHDLCYKQQIDQIQTYIQENQNQSFVTTNILYKSNNQSFGKAYKLIQTSQGMNILNYGFMYASNNQYDYLYIPDPIKIAEQLNIEDIISLDQLDLLILNFHIGYETPSLHEVYNVFRKKYPQLPILIVAAHDHLLYQGDCQFLQIKDQQCYMIDAGNYAKYLNVLDITCNKDQGYSQCQFNLPYSDQSFTYSNIPQRFDLTQSNFDTFEGNFINQQINKLAEDYGVSDIVAWNKLKLSHSANVLQDNSMQRQWNFDIFNSMIYNEIQNIQNICYHLPVTRTALTRADLQQGYVSKEDLTNSIPYHFRIQQIANLTSEQGKCIFDYLNTGLWNYNFTSHEELLQKFTEIIENNNVTFEPEYSTQNELWNETCYNFIMGDYEVQRATSGFQICGVDNQTIDIVNYDTDSGYEYTNEIYLAYYGNFQQQNQYELSKKDYNYNDTITMSAICFAVLLLFVIIVSIYEYIKYHKSAKGKYKILASEKDSTKEETNI